MDKIDATSIENANKYLRYNNVTASRYLRVERMQRGGEEELDKSKIAS